ncbi:aminotransferase class I/II-fold pyridoxal phosphate-dependent enzyme [Lacibacter luteus]|uniref:Aminotransferase class I/II-fold pyridoxal phosphate-dependent enzyme n=1 Tax=Lacibacter luteus TaxID=2508719 RepID=A0A4Q1CJK9_9BACT|nr:methionine aminotransferase [Lacibacter luteus]RXK60763.1 aminotransferase class I/II-fold pyridoxal phosphate-dependent enzyme [Lacibacter luteus]
MQIKSKLPNVGTTIFTVMSALATEHKAVNLGQGFPDYPMSEELTAKVAEAMRNGHNQYAPMPGLIGLRESIAEKVEFLYKTKINPDTEITITPGGTYAIYSSLTTILQPGDEVILFEPAYDSYIPNIEINGAKAVPLPLTYPDYKIDWDLVRSSITAKTKAILINSPHNPTGSVLDKNDIAELKSIVAGTELFIVSDEVYEHLIYDELPHESMLKYPELFERSFVNFSFGKTYHCTGWKLGYCIAPAAFTKEFRKVHQFNCFSCFTPAQVALAEYLKNKDAYLSLPRFMQQKRDYFIELMKNTKFDLLSTSGSYFICASYGRISEESDKDLAIRLTKEAGVATIPLSAFYHNQKDDKVVRFCFSKQNRTLQQAVERLMKI